MDEENKFPSLGNEFAKYIMSRFSPDKMVATRALVKYKNNQISSTDGCFFVQYRPYTKDGRKMKARPYVVHADILPHESNRYKDWEQFKQNVHGNLGQDWILNYTTISEEIFKIATDNPRLKIFFPMDYTKYMSEIGLHLSLESIQYHYGGKKKCPH